VLGIKAEFREENAEALSFADATFDHVNCSGVVHHTTDPQKAVAEIARVLKPGGTALISVYYKNFILRRWAALRYLGKLFARAGAGMAGRGRESIYALDDVGEIVRRYDGAENPIGLAYSEAEFAEMLSPYFTIDKMYLHFFPARSLPFAIPKPLHRMLDRNLGFMIFANMHKR
jgi:SAM-dependent methyltransferase